MALCKEISSRDPSATWAVKRLGFLYLSQDVHAYEAAIPSFHAALRSQPNDPATWEGLGSAYQALGRFTAALKAYSKAIELDSNTNNTRLYSLVQCGRLHLLLGSQPESLASYKAALLIDDEHPSALLGASEALVSGAAYHLGLGAPGVAADELREALEYAEQCTKRYSSLTSAWKQLGDVLLMHHSITTSISDSSQAQVILMMERARKAYARALFLAPHQPNSYADIAATYYHQYLLLDNTTSSSRSVLAEKACRMVQGGLRIDPTNSELWTALGVAAINPSVKEYALSRALQLDPKATDAWIALARLYMSSSSNNDDDGNRKKRHLAERCLQQARSQDPVVAQIWEAMSALASLNNEVGDSGEYAEHAVGLGAGAEGLVIYTSSYFTIGGGFSNKKKNSSIAAGRVYAGARKAVELAPNNPAAHNALGLASEAKGDAAGAIDCYNRAVLLLVHSTDDDNIMNGIKLNMARALYSAGKYQESIDTYQQLLIDTLPTAHLLYYGLALYHSNTSGDNSKAVEATSVLQRCMQAATAEGCSVGCCRAAEALVQIDGSLLMMCVAAAEAVDAPVEKIARLFTTAMASASISTTNNSQQLMMDAIYTEARMWANRQEKNWKGDAAFISQLLQIQAASRLLSSSSSSSNREARIMLSKTVHINPCSSDARVQLAASALLHKESDASKVIAASRLLYDDADGLFQTTADNNPAVVHKLKSLAALSQCSSGNNKAVERQLAHASRSAAKTIFMNPLAAADTWYLGAVVSTALSAASSTTTKAQFQSALAWCRAASSVVGSTLTDDEEKTTKMMLRLLVCTSENALRLGDVETAQSSISHALQLCQGKPLNSMVLRQQARCALVEDKIEEAVQLYRQALEAATSADNTDSYETVVSAMELSHLLFRQGRAQQATEILQQTLDTSGGISSSDSTTNGSIMMLQLALAFIELGDTEQAKQAALSSSVVQNNNNNNMVALLIQGAAALRGALQLLPNQDDSNSKTALLGEARKVLSECLNRLQATDTSTQLLLRVLLAQTESAGTLRKKEERVQAHVSEAMKCLKSSRSSTSAADVLVLLGSVTNNKALCAKAVHTAPWKQHTWHQLI